MSLRLLAIATLLSLACADSASPKNQALCDTCPGIGCIDFQTDPLHCGSCTNVCPVGYGCFQGACECGHEREACCPMPSGALTCAGADGGCLQCCPLSLQVPPYGYCQLACNAL